MRLAVFGLGYVGSVSAACLAKHGHHVIGVDINPLKVKMINTGKSPILEKGITKLVKDVVNTGRLSATDDIGKAVRSTECALICVGTPSLRNGNIDLKYVKRVIRNIGLTLCKNKRFYAVIIRSTMLPGCTEKIVKPMLERYSRRKIGKSLGLCVNPEFLREGSSIYDFDHPPFTLIGTSDGKGGNILRKIYKRVNAPIIVKKIKVIEMAKYMSNAYHALKIVFANEIGNICKREGIDSYEAMEIFVKDKKLNISKAYLKPGYAFGGSCLPKDLRAILFRAKMRGLKLPVLENILPSNALQIGRVLDMVLDTGERRVGVLGLSFKPGTDDLRESPIVELVELLIGKGFDVRIYDRNVSLSNIIGANKQYIQKKLPHIKRIIARSLDEVLSHAKVLIIANRDKAYTAVLPKKVKSKVVIDLVRIMTGRNKTGIKYRGVCW